MDIFDDMLFLRNSNVAGSCVGSLKINFAFDFLISCHVFVHLRSVSRKSLQFIHRYQLNMAEAASSENIEVDNSSGKRIKRKGRGHNNGGNNEEDRYDGRGGIFEKIEQDMSTSGPSQCKLSEAVCIA